MYQLYAYLRSQEQPGDPGNRATFNRRSAQAIRPWAYDYDESTIIQGHRVSFATVDLAADSQTIRSQLLRTVDRCNGMLSTGRTSFYPFPPTKVLLGLGASLAHDND